MAKSMSDIMSSIEQLGSGLDWEIRVTAPVDIREIPESVLSRTNGIHFEDSNDTLRRHLEYL
jgi:hypothetical protein